MKIAFLASRKGYLKVTGSLIQAALDRGHAVVLIRDPGQRKPGEATTDEDFKHWPAARVLVHKWGSPILPILKVERAAALVAPSLHVLLGAMNLEREVPQLRAAGIRLYSVDYAFETVTSDPQGYRAIDCTFYQSEFQRRLHWEAQAAGFAALGPEGSLEARSAVCGSTMMDQRALVTDPATVRRKYGLPPDKPIVLFMSLKMAVPEPWRRLVWGRGWWRRRAARAHRQGHPDWADEIREQKGRGYLRLFQSVRRFCADNGAVLVVKSRKKNADPPVLARLADRFIEKDEDVFPYNSMELMAISALCIHFQSGAVLEAAFCGVPSISIRVPQSHLERVPAFQESFGGAPDTLQNFAGIVWSSDRSAADRFLEGRKLADFAVNPDARRAYVDKYLGFDDARSSQRVLDVIERRGQTW